MTKRDKRTAYLIGVQQGREAVRVYAVVTASRDAALAQVRALAADDVWIEIVGGLSRDMVRRLGLEPGEVRLI